MLMVIQRKETRGFALDSRKTKIELARRAWREEKTC